MAHEPNLALGMLCTHHIITRGLNISIEYSNPTLKDEKLNESSKDGFIDYVQSLKTVLTTHHHLETIKIFPYFKEKIPELPVDKLNKEHGKIGIQLMEIEKIIPDLKDEATLKKALNQLNMALTNINEIWHPHIDLEEKFFTVKVVEHLIGHDEMLDLLGSYAEFIMECNQPDYLVIPFQYYSLPLKEREIWAQQLPEIVTQKMIPFKWKGKWSKMADFLILDG